jgi:vacuolar-type H+-ATPase catalytic subunit A/Vma1
MVPPRQKGKVNYIAPEGDYTIIEPILELECEGKIHKIAMTHQWPVRQTRPYQEKLAGNVPLLTG